VNTIKYSKQLGQRKTSDQEKFARSKFN